VTTVIYFISPKTDSSFTMTESTLTVLTHAHPSLLMEPRPTLPSCVCSSANFYANATSIPSINGGGDHGHLGLIMSAANYALVVEPMVQPSMILQCSLHRCQHDCRNATKLMTYKTEEEYKIAKQVDVSQETNPRSCPHEYILQSLADDSRSSPMSTRLPCSHFTDTRCYHPDDLKTTCQAQPSMGSNSPIETVCSFCCATVRNRRWRSDPDATAIMKSSRPREICVFDTASLEYVQAHGRSHLCEFCRSFARNRTHAHLSRHWKQVFSQRQRSVQEDDGLPPLLLDPRCHHQPRSHLQNLLQQAS
jgi:hypothetical protein